MNRLWSRFQRKWLSVIVLVLQSATAQLSGSLFEVICLDANNIPIYLGVFTDLISVENKWTGGSSHVLLFIALVSGCDGQTWHLFYFEWSHGFTGKSQIHLWHECLCIELTLDWNKPNVKKQAGFDCVYYVSLAAESLLTASKLKALCTQIKIICMKIKKAHYIYNETWLLT